MKKILIYLFLSIGLAGCGGGSNIPTTTDTTEETGTIEETDTTEEESGTVPTLANFSGSIVENANVGDTVGEIIIRDTGSSSITSITLTGTGNTNFQVDNSGQVTVSNDAELDYETTPSYTLSAIATNSAGNSNAVELIITIDDFLSPLEIAKLKASDATSGDYFGEAVAISGNYIVVGAARNDDDGANSGSSYVFKINSDDNISQIAKLTASDADSSDRFGGAVAISGNYIVIGSVEDEDESGSSYVFKISSDDSVTQIAKLRADDAESEDYFGDDVAISGHYIIVGAPGDDDNGESSGSSYVFKIGSDDTISQIAKLTADDASAYDYFGSVAISGNYIVVGAYRDDDNDDDSGSSYVFKINSDDSISQIAKLITDDGDIDDYFGASVAIDDDFIIVGAFKDDSGSSYVFKIGSDDSIYQVAKLTADDGEVSDYFGVSVAISSNYIVVGASLDDDNGNKSGSSYIFKIDSEDNVTQVSKLIDSNGTEDDSFGYATAISGDYIVLGAYQSDDAGNAFVISMEPQDRPYWTNNTSIINYDEGTDLASFYDVLLTSINSGGISSNISGADSSNFTFNSNQLMAINSLDYETPIDTNGDNIYEFNLNLVDGAGQEYSYSMNVEVIDKAALEVAQLTATDGADSDYLGYSVAVSGDYIVVGAYQDDDNGINSGSSYVFKIDSDGYVSQIAKLTASDGASNDSFGRSVAINGNFIVVGAHGDDDNGSFSGSSYVFKINSDDNISQIAKLTASDGAESDFFGRSVAISGDYIVVGADGEDDNGNASGSSYVFKIGSDDSISQIQKLTASDGEASDKFGLSVDISGDYIVVGAYSESDNGSNSGASYVFKIGSDDTVSELQKITANDASAYDYFGYSVAISGDYIVVGAYGEDGAEIGSGSSYLFKIAGDDSVTQISKLMASDAGNSDSFGYSVAISGDYIVVGAYLDDDNGSDSGSSYIFKIGSDDTVTQLENLTASNGGNSDNLGYSVAIDGEYIVGGAYKHNEETGSSYVFKLDANQE